MAMESVREDDEPGGGNRTRFSRRKAELFRRGEGSEQRDTILRRRGVRGVAGDGPLRDEVAAGGWQTVIEIKDRAEGGLA